jgi:hypothetical protein
MPIIQLRAESIVSELLSRLAKQKHKTLSEIKAKMVGCVVQKVVYLPRKHKALSSNPSTTINNNQKKEKHWFNEIIGE